MNLDHYTNLFIKDFINNDLTKVGWLNPKTNVLHTPLELKNALAYLASYSPKEYRLLQYSKLMTQYTNNKISKEVKIDFSTLKRYWNKAAYIIVNVLTNKELL